MTQPPSIGRCQLRTSKLKVLFFPPWSVKEINVMAIRIEIMRFVYILCWLGGGTAAITTVFGNGTVEETTRNALIVLQAAGLAEQRHDDAESWVPVYPGASRPLLGEPFLAHHVHGSSALGPDELQLSSTGEEDAH